MRGDHRTVVLYPRYAPIYVMLVLAVSISLIGATYHGDIIAGGFIGATVTVLCVRLFPRDWRHTKVRRSKRDSHNRDTHSPTDSAIAILPTT